MIYDPVGRSRNGASPSIIGTSGNQWQQKQQRQQRQRQVTFTLLDVKNDYSQTQLRLSTFHADRRQLRAQTVTFNVNRKFVYLGVRY